MTARVDVVMVPTTDNANPYVDVRLHLPDQETIRLAAQLWDKNGHLDREILRELLSLV